MILMHIGGDLWSVTEGHMSSGFGGRTLYRGDFDEAMRIFDGRTPEEQRRARDAARRWLRAWQRRRRAEERVRQRCDAAYRRCLKRGLEAVRRAAVHDLA